MNYDRLRANQGHVEEETTKLISCPAIDIWNCDLINKRFVNGLARETMRGSGSLIDYRVQQHDTYGTCQSILENKTT